MLLDTIAAISTPFSKGGIAIVRISGSNAAEIVKKIFTGEIDTSHTIRYGYVYNPETGANVDEALVTYMKAPFSYTKEDVVEINCHSGTAVMNQILSLTLKYGARLAEPGEFTKRAFLNGRIDLTKAEAVIDIINAKTGLSAQNAVNQLTGRLYDEIKGFMDGVLLCLANIEASIDFPEHSDTDVQNDFLINNIQKLINGARRLHDTSDIGRIVKNGINTVIIGNTNVGKSSLLNYFAGVDRAIVTDIHGTTRDILEESINLNGVLLNMFDTAGIRPTDDVIENIGIQKAKSAAESADLILAVFDGSRPLLDEEINVNTDAKALALINKTDLALKTDINAIKLKFGEDNTFLISVKDKTGLDAVADRIKRLFIKGEIEPTTAVTNVRHADALLKCISGLNSALSALEGGFPSDIASVGLTEAYNCLCAITGDNIQEDLVEKIFSQFCLGK